ncbi:hypothetical protein AVEN_65055-1 [Araneus ventricosus]|uniref:SOCS box domain-containing protein n=1 Tax=Araneus ventricosus TaxID=182803 RepID=A0A4Y2MHD9_ARAVE|nr:hypothetical protein AVEN_65055-1 [Araneus ventricosus]
MQYRPGPRPDFFFDNISPPKKKFADIYIDEADDVVKYSFVVHKSVTYLDLSLCELSVLKGKTWGLRIPMTPKSILYRVLLKKYICTEEACKKHLAPNRKLLYNFHLDVPNRLERSLQNTEPYERIRYCSKGVLLNKIGTKPNWFEKEFNEMINEIFMRTRKKVKFLRRVSEAAKRLKFIGKNRYIREKGLFFLYAYHADSTAVVDFMTAMDFEDGFFLGLHPKALEFYVQRTHRASSELGKLPFGIDLINASIGSYPYREYEKVVSLFKFCSAPRFCKKTYEETKLRIDWKSLNLPDDTSETPVKNGLMTKERYFLILQILDIYLDDGPEELESLQLVWRSIPDVVICLDELKAAFPALMGTKRIKEIHGYIRNITGEEAVFPQPRSLKHYCRCAVRKILCGNGQLSTGIDSLALMSELQSYLKLER